jgi:SAM-dependent methyltransferase
MNNNAWDLAAEDYSNLIGDKGDVWRQILINPEIINALKNLPQGAKILDLGCGEGYLSRVFDSRWEYVGVDNSSRLLEIAKAKGSHGDFIEADITKPLGYHDEFDAVIANMVLMDVENIGSVYDNAYTALKSTGVFVVTIPHPAFRRPVAILAKTWWGKLWRSDPFIRIDTYAKGFSSLGRLTKVSKATMVFHRPLSRYIQIALDQKFKLKDIQELSPDKQDLIKWGQPLFFAKFPVNLFLVFVKDEKH